MDARDYLRIVRKGWIVILAFATLGLGASVGLTLSQTKVYQSSTEIFVATPDTTSAGSLAQGNTFTQDRVQSYVDIANVPDVTQPVITQLHLAMTPGELAKKISADAPANKVLINLHVTDPNPVLAATIANALSRTFIAKVEAVEGTQTVTDASGTGTTKVPVVTLSQLRPATIPGTPISPNRTVNLTLGLLLGLLAGLIFVVVRDVLDNTVKSPDDVAALGTPLLGLVPFDKRAPKTAVAFRDDAHGLRAEAYRQLRTNMQFIDVDNPPRLIAVTSALPGEGKTTTAINLAASLAEAGFRVCLIDADLRRPSIATLLGLVGDVGLTTMLISDAAVEDVLQNAGKNLAVLTSGPIPPNPSELLISQHAKRILADIASAVDYTIIDTPPLLPVTDGAELASVADATVIVARAGKSTRDQSKRAIEALQKVGERPVGMILNMVTRTGRFSGYEYGYYYESYRPQASSKSRGRGKGTTESQAASAALRAKANGSPTTGTAAGDRDDAANVPLGLEVLNGASRTGDRTTSEHGAEV